jgi:hypothetical protein
MEEETNNPTLTHNSNINLASAKMLRNLKTLFLHLMYS